MVIEFSLPGKLNAGAACVCSSMSKSSTKYNKDVVEAYASLFPLRLMV